MIYILFFNPLRKISSILNVETKDALYTTPGVANRN